MSGGIAVVVFALMGVEAEDREVFVPESQVLVPSLGHVSLEAIARQDTPKSLGVLKARSVH